MWDHNEMRNRIECHLQSHLWARQDLKGLHCNGLQFHIYYAAQRRHSWGLIRSVHFRISNCEASLGSDITYNSVFNAPTDAKPFFRKIQQTFKITFAEFWHTLFCSVHHIFFQLQHKTIFSIKSCIWWNVVCKFIQQKVINIYSINVAKSNRC